MGKPARLHPVTVQEVLQSTTELIPQGVQMIHAPVQWEKGRTGKEVIVATIDTGVDYNHPDLKDNIIGGEDFTSSGDYFDDNGHGTHVAGTIAATSKGYGITGVAPDVKILALKALDSTGSGDMKDIVAAVKYATEYGVHIINMSVGGEHSDELYKAVKAAVAKGIIICVAAGNNGDGDTNTEELSYPGAYHEVIEVGAVDYAGNLAYFSNTNHEVDILAPGVQILSTYPNGKYAKLDGTSMSTPHVTGAIALLMSKTISDYTKGDYILDLSTAIASSAEVKPVSVEVESPVHKLMDVIRKLFGGKK